MNGWRITGTVEPGMWSSTARSSGSGSRRSGCACNGIVDHRFDHIESGSFSPAGRAHVLRVVGDQVHFAAPDARQRPLAHRRLRVVDERRERTAVHAVAAA